MNEEQYERYERPGEVPPKEPIEPFLPDEAIEPEEPIADLVKRLKMPKLPLTKKSLKAFLVDLRPVASKIHQVGHRDLLVIESLLSQVKNELHNQGFADKIIRQFESITDHFNDLLTRLKPINPRSLFSAVEDMFNDL